MKNKIKKWVNAQIYKTVYQLIENHNTTDDLDTIFRRTLKNMATEFLSERNKPRDSEQLTLTTLIENVDDNLPTTQIERNLLKNLSKIRPVWGEFFGTHRGRVFQAFHYLLQWPCFNASTRSLRKTEQVKQLQHTSDQQQQILSQYKSQLQKAGETLKESHQSSARASQRSAQQFITIQQLTADLSAANALLEETNREIKQLKERLSKNDRELVIRI